MLKQSFGRDGGQECRAEGGAVRAPVTTEQAEDSQWWPLLPARSSSRCAPTRAVRNLQRRRAVSHWLCGTSFVSFCKQKSPKKSMWLLSKLFEAPR